MPPAQSQAVFLLTGRVTQVYRRISAFLQRPKLASTLTVILLLLALAVVSEQTWRIAKVFILGHRGQIMLVEPWFFSDRALDTMSAFYPVFIARRFLQRHAIWPALTAPVAVLGLFILVARNVGLAWPSIVLVAVHFLLLLFFVIRDERYLARLLRAASSVPRTRGFRLSQAAFAAVWPAVTLSILAFYPIYSTYPELWEQGIFPVIVGVVGCWISLRLLRGSFAQCALSSVAFLLWLLFLFGWARQLYGLS